MPNMSKQTEREIKEKMIWLTKKYNVSRFIFLLASILLIIMNAFTGVISAYAIAKNNNLHSVAIFIAIAFITTTLTFLSSLSTVLFFVLSVDFHLKLFIFYYTQLFFHHYLNHVLSLVCFWPLDY